MTQRNKPLARFEELDALIQPPPRTRHSAHGHAGVADTGIHPRATARRATIHPPTTGAVRPASRSAESGAPGRERPEFTRRSLAVPLRTPPPGRAGRLSPHRTRRTPERLADVPPRTPPPPEPRLRAGSPVAESGHSSPDAPTRHAEPGRPRPSGARPASERMPGNRNPGRTPPVGRSAPLQRPPEGLAAGRARNARPAGRSSTASRSTVPAVPTAPRPPSAPVTRFIGISPFPWAR